MIVLVTRRIVNMKNIGVVISDSYFHPNKNKTGERQKLLKLGYRKMPVLKTWLAAMKLECSTTMEKQS